MTRFKIILISAIAIAGLTASLVIRRQAQIKLQENDAVLLQQDNQLAGLAAENQRLSKLVDQTNNAPGDDLLGELARLRSQAEALRQQRNELGRPRADNLKQSVSERLASVAYAKEHNRYYYDPRADAKVADGKAFIWLVTRYAHAHQGQVPSNLDQVLPYLPEAANRVGDLAKFTGTNQFELVFQGSLNELTNIPPRTVALIREPLPWLTPEGKWVRVYGYADGWAEIVQPYDPDDNFQSWEAAHIIPPPSSGQQ